MIHDVMGLLPVLIAFGGILLGCVFPITNPTTMSSKNVIQAEVMDPHMSDSIELIKYIHEILNDGLICERKYFNEELKAERDATNAKLLKVNTCLATRVEAVDETIEHHSDTLVDIHLKLETSGLYYLELINSLRTEFQESLNNAKKEIQSLKDKAAPNCIFCGQTFQSTDHLVVHVVNYHSLIHGYCQQNIIPQPSTPEFICNVCHYTFLSKEDLSKHTDDHHGQAPPIQSVSHATPMSGAPLPRSCSICCMLFTTEEGLEDHMWSHRDISTHTCSELVDAETLDDRYSPLQTNTAPLYSSSPLYSPQPCIGQDISPIPQCDGADDGVLETVVTQPSSVSSLSVSYELNKQRQVGRLVRDVSQQMIMVEMLTFSAL